MAWIVRELKIYSFYDKKDISIEQQISLAVRHNLNGIEISTVDGLELSDITLLKAQEIKNKIDDSGLKVLSIASNIGFIDFDDDFDKHIEQLKNTLKIANILKTDNIRIFSLLLPETAYKNDYKNQAIDRLGKISEICLMAGINPLHENMLGTFGENSDTCLKIFESLPVMKGIFNSNEFFSANENIEDSWKRLKKFVKYIRITNKYITDNESAKKILTINKEILKDFLYFGGKNIVVSSECLNDIGNKIIL